MIARHQISPICVPRSTSAGDPPPAQIGGYLKSSSISQRDLSVCVVDM
ncbi:MAG TPA: hypothetical protein VMV07_20050 [Streptosporangiaceae bacterium]|nr:hypothetical protein [Streptosporangiaceae bacterium]